MTEPQTEDPMVAALLREREGYAVRGMDARVAQVDEQLKLRGHEPSADGKPAPASRSTPPKGRRARPAEQA
ncbi:hypothetical protein PV735_31610 [Streptomyces turgidiscabies]|uniref:hypothetical protein n=1 Tax=Streptomyces turgidiscabies TaxID=85558 RepID=UPI0029BAC8C6|nr:hypothetical protein [Streptomyces turgidiscabies]MDX3497199.1 hypothetical protein [Streptomyces turgidiscabies]